MNKLKDEIKMSISIPKNIYEAMLEVSHNNKLKNIRKQLKGENKRPDKLAELVRIACEEKYLRKKK